jgi:hypothetical protein
MPMLVVATICIVVLGAWLARFAFPHAPSAGYAFFLLDDQKLIGAPAVQKVLEGTPSGMLVDISERVSIKPIATLPNQSGTWCRVLELRYRTGPTGLSLACRAAEGAWLVPVTVPANKTYISAGKEVQEAEQDVLAAVKRFGLSITPEREDRVMRGQWREKP